LIPVVSLLKPGGRPLVSQVNEVYGWNCSGQVAKHHSRVQEAHPGNPKLTAEERVVEVTRGL